MDEDNDGKNSIAIAEALPDTAARKEIIDMLKAHKSYKTPAPVAAVRAGRGRRRKPRGEEPGSPAGGQT